MKLRLSRTTISFCVVVSLLMIDQIIKVLVKMNMYLHQSIHITDWFYIYFTENPGMAFGMEIMGKLFLSVFRIIAVCAIVYFMRMIVRNKSFSTGYVVCWSFILAGAIGNIFDSLFYGEIFTDSINRVASLVPWGEGYSSIFYGKVVDMFYFPLFAFDWPSWMPFVGGEHFIFFSPIFNFADACISCGLIALLLFYSKSLSRSFKKQSDVHEDKNEGK